MVKMNSIPWSPILRYATPLPMNRNPVSTVALQHKSVSSVLRYATHLPINRTPVLTVGGPFPIFCGTPGPSRSTGPRFDRRRSVSSILRYARPLPMNMIPFRMWPVEHKAVSSVLWYARPRFHRLFRPRPPGEHDDAFRSDQAGWLPMNTTTTTFLRSDPAMYTSPGRTYARVGVRDPARMYVRDRIFFLAHWPLYVRVHATCTPLL